MILGLMLVFSVSTPSSSRARGRAFTFCPEKLAVIDEPGLHFLWLRFGPKAFLLSVSRPVLYLATEAWTRNTCAAIR